MTILRKHQAEAVAAPDFKVFSKDRFNCLLGSKPNKINDLLLESSVPLSIKEVSEKTGVALSLTKDYFERYGILPGKKLADVLVKTVDEKYYIQK
jgi:hypothetical protein